MHPVSCRSSAIRPALILFRLALGVSAITLLEMPGLRGWAPAYLERCAQRMSQCLPRGGHFLLPLFPLFSDQLTVPSCCSFRGVVWTRSTSKEEDCGDRSTDVERGRLHGCAVYVPQFCSQTGSPPTTLGSRLGLCILVNSVKKHCIPMMSEYYDRL